MPSNSPNFREKLLQEKAVIDRQLDELLPSTHGHGEKLIEAERYAVFPGGKRVRPIAARAVLRMLKCNPDEFARGVCALELVHISSLILDDLPCMDDATLRHGKPSLHHAYDVSTAILAAISLLNEAFLWVSRDAGNDRRVHRALIEELSLAIGVNGMVAGQFVELQHRGKVLDLERLDFIHSHKTASLFIASVRVPAILARASAKEIESLTHYAKNLGLAYQIMDDILDATSAPSALGKDTHKDKKQTTFVSLSGLEEARQLVQELTEFAIESLRPFGQRAQFLIDLATFLSRRDR